MVLEIIQYFELLLPYFVFLFGLCFSDSKYFESKDFELEGSESVDFEPKDSNPDEEDFFLLH